MRKLWEPSGVVKKIQVSSLYLLVLLLSNHNGVISSTVQLPQGVGGQGAGKHVVITLPNKNPEGMGVDGAEKFPSFSRTMAVLGSRIKKKIGEAHKSLFPLDINPVKRVGQVGKKQQVSNPHLHNHNVVHLKPWETNEKRSLDPLQASTFRPHQPDITSEMRGGKLTLPVTELGEEGGVAEIARTRAQPKPTPMANTINPYTNGVAASFPPGIDPYDGFIKYAAENLDTPMGNMIDYHSLEHYYGPQHPLSPYHKKEQDGAGEGPRTQPYADSFSYVGNNEVETSNSPPPPPPPRGPPPPGHGPRGPGFRPHHSPGGPIENPHHHYSMNSQEEHGVDMFHAPSPGEPHMKPRPGGLGHHPPDDEEEFGRRPPPPPLRRPMQSSPFPNKPRGPPPPMHHHRHHPNHPFSESPDGEISENNAPPPPDLSVFEEGPPPELLSPGSGSEGPGPLSSPPFPTDEENAPPPHPHNIENEQMQTLDGGDDAIWGILDLAQMLEKGQIPGSSGSTANQDKSQSNSVAPSRNPSQADRVVIPIFNRPPPPRMSPSSGEGDGSGRGGPFSSSPSGDHDYDDNDEDSDYPSPPAKTSHQLSNADSQESLNDY